MNIIENLSRQIYSCKVVPQKQKVVDLRNYLEKVVYPRLKSHAIFLDLIDSLENEHPLRGCEVTTTISEDYRQLAEHTNKAEAIL